MNDRRSTPHNSQPSIELHIEELVLHGLPLSRGEGPEVQAAVETELARLLSEQGVNHFNASDTSRLSAGSIQLTNNHKPAQLGHQIAQAVYGGLTQNSVPSRQDRTPEGASR